MPRQSSASLTVISASGVETIRRPSPPPGLNEEQELVWIEIVNRMPAEWFPRETHELLIQYCRITIRLRRIAEMIDSLEKSRKRGVDGFDIELYRDLIKDENACTKTLAILAR